MVFKKFCEVLVATNGASCTKEGRQQYCHAHSNIDILLVFSPFPLSAPICKCMPQIAAIKLYVAAFCRMLKNTDRERGRESAKCQQTSETKQNESKQNRNKNK